MKSVGLGNNSIRLLISSLAFASGWFSLGFIFPLVAEGLGFSYTFIGLIGLAGSLPFPVVAFFYRRSTRRALKLGISLPLAILTALSLALLFDYQDYFVPIAVLASICQAPWWISNEIALSEFEGSRNAEKYSVGWGIPNAVVPLVMGVIVARYGFRPIFAIAMVGFVIAIALSPRIGTPVNTERKSSLRVRYLFALFFAGIFSGFIYFLIEPLLEQLGFSYYFIGLVISIYGSVAAVGYIVLNFMKSLRIWQYSFITSLFIFPTAFLALQVSAVMIVAVAALGGIGVSISMSKVLAYISESSDTGTGVFYYETFFGTGFIAGSLGGDVLFQVAGIGTVPLLFVWALVYSVGIYLWREKQESRSIADYS